MPSIKNLQRILLLSLLCWAAACSDISLPPIPFTHSKAAQSEPPIAVATPEPTPQPTPPPDEAAPVMVQKGLACWYGGSWHGRQTANGEYFDKTDMTAASPNLPFGSKVLVRNLDNQKELQVRITDRCLGTKGRVIDVSESAAKELGFHRAGVAKVQLDVMQLGDGCRVEDISAGAMRAKIGKDKGSAVLDESMNSDVNRGMSDMEKEAEAMIAGGKPPRSGAGASGKSMAVGKSGSVRNAKTVAKKSGSAKAVASATKATATKKTNSAAKLAASKSKAANVKTAGSASGKESSKPKVLVPDSDAKVRVSRNAAPAKTSPSEAKGLKPGEKDIQGKPVAAL